MPIKAKTTKYEFDLNEIKNILIKELGLSPDDKITIEYELETKHSTGQYADFRDDNSYKECCGVTVTVKSK